MAFLLKDFGDFSIQNAKYRASFNVHEYFFLTLRDLPGVNCCSHICQVLLKLQFQCNFERIMEFSQINLKINVSAYDGASEMIVATGGMQSKIKIVTQMPSTFIVMSRNYLARWLRGNARDSHSGGTWFKFRCLPTWLGFKKKAGPGG